MPKVVIAGLIQLVSFILLIIIVWLLPMLISPPYNPLFLSLGMGLIAVSFSVWFKLPRWWFLLQFIFPLAIYLALDSALTPLFSLIAFLALWLIFSNSFKDRVPLYLTNNMTREALKDLASSIDNVRFIDLGSGLGGNVVYMSKLDKVTESIGVETAPLPYLISKIYSKLAGGEILAQDLWKVNLQNFNLVYAFLSPEPMEKLWLKVRSEMLPDTIFVANSFAVPNIEPSEIWQLADSRKTHLYIYKLKDFT